MEADEKIKRVDIEERQSSLLSPSPSLFPTIIFDIVCYFCGIFITKSGGFSRFSGRPSLLCSAVQQQMLELTLLVVLLLTEEHSWRNVFTTVIAQAYA